MALPPKTVRQSKNFFALGMVYWLFSRPMEPTIGWLQRKFRDAPDVMEANLKVLQSGWNYALLDDRLFFRYNIRGRATAPGHYRNINGNHAVALGLVAAARKARLSLFLGTYPITPATDILHYISGYKKYGVKHLQAEDEIAGISSAIGAAYGGYLAATTTSGPGLSLKIEALGLAVMTELPLVVVDVQRAGPSTGLPTKPEQSDLLQAMYGRHGEAPLPVLAASSAANCFAMTVEAARIALKYMTPVILLTDGYIAQGSEPWRIPDEEELPDFSVNFPDDHEHFVPYSRDPETLARPWAVPGIKGMEHRIGGLEKQNLSGHVSHDPLNHQKMVEIRREKVNRIQGEIPPLEVHGAPSGKLLIIGWGSTYGAIRTAFDKKKKEMPSIGYVHLHHLNPLPPGLGRVMKQFEHILVPEMNLGQLQTILQGRYLLPVQGLHKVQGAPFTSAEIERAIDDIVLEESVEEI